jgi:4-hydroxythreonine-4-phosphate dehydrogenase
MDTKEYAMLLAHGPFRVSHVTTHASLRKACEMVKKERILSVISIDPSDDERIGY